MTKRAIVHIGTPKAGSTSIQSFLNLNRDTLRVEGFAVPDMYGANHLAFMPMSYAPGRWDELCADLARGAGFGQQRPSSSDWLSYIESKRQEFSTWANSVDVECLVITSEGQVRFLLDKRVGDGVRFGLTAGAVRSA